MWTSYIHYYACSKKETFPEDLVFWIVLVCVMINNSMDIVIIIGTKYLTYFTTVT